MGALYAFLLAKGCGYLGLRSVQEEFTLRGYLITRLGDLVKPTWIPVVVSAALFAAVRLPLGILFVPMFFAMGLILTVIFRVTGSIWPGAIATFAAMALEYLLRFHL
ncbi:MAG TPA: CPBP family intramembrane glutamic endopeptidase [Fimbriimonadaceae bacterium]|nr:CPBP family intramembrane glutamic endopeptidase [Fimbriimonadaceae bacterium]